VKRLLLALLLGLIATLAVFWLMQWMISVQTAVPQSSEKLLMTEFVRLKKESTIQTKQRKLPDPPPEKQPPPPPPTTMQVSPVAAQANTPQMNMPALDIPLNSSRFTGSVVSGLQMGQGKISTNLIPLVRIPPRYPMRAARRRIEGWVKVEFTITEQGTVKDPVVVESHPADIFDRAALSAIRRWKFKPKIIDGVPFEQRAIQILKFKLSK
jgi:protein TonB